MTTYNYCIFNNESPEFTEYEDVDDEPCRLSWFIIKKDNDPEATQSHITESGYTVVHAMDITKPSYANIFLNNTVSYNTRKERLTGQVIAAADNLELIRANLKVLENAAENPSASDRYCLVQYAQTEHRLVHKILQENELIEFHTSSNNFKEIFIRDGKRLYRGNMLMRDASRDMLQNELATLKEKCSDAILRSSCKDFTNVEDDARLEPDVNTWLLLQHSENHFDSVYSIMRYDDTYMLKGNMYPGLQAYFGNRNTTYQAVILQKSDNEAELLGALKTITNSCCMPVSHS